MNYQENAAPIMANGSAKNPLTPEKGTFAKWQALQHQKMSQRTIDWYCERRWWTGEGRRKVFGRDCERIGLVHGNVHGYVSVDIDISDPESASEVDAVAKAMLPETPLVRIGRAPKQLLMFRADGAVMSNKPKPIEIFASSGQIAAFGLHPGTGKPYEWIHGHSPLDTKVADLPPVTQDKISAFLETLDLEVTFRQVNPDGTVSEYHGTFDWAAASAERKEGGIQACIRQLEVAHRFGRNDTLMSITAYLWAEGKSEQFIVEFIDKFLPDHSKNEEFGSQLVRFERQRIPALESTVRSMVRRANRKWEDGVAL